MVQLTGTYGFELTKAQAGQKYDIRPDWVMSAAAEVDINPGQPVQRGTDPEKQVLLGNAASFYGVALFTHTLEQAFPAGGASYAIGQTVSVLTKGAVWVTSAVDGVVAGAPAYVTDGGTFTPELTDNLLVGKFITGGGEGDLVVLELA